MYASHAIKSGLYLSESMSSISLPWSCQNKNNPPIIISREETIKNVGLNFQLNNIISLGISI